MTPPTERDGGRPLGARRAPRGPKKEPAATLSLSTETLFLRWVRLVSPLNAERKTDVLPKECNQFTSLECEIFIRLLLPHEGVKIR